MISAEETKRIRDNIDSFCGIILHGNDLHREAMENFYLSIVTSKGKFDLAAADIKLHIFKQWLSDLSDAVKKEQSNDYFRLREKSELASRLLFLFSGMMMVDNEISESEKRKSPLVRVGKKGASVLNILECVAKGKYDDITLPAGCMGVASLVDAYFFARSAEMKEAAPKMIECEPYQYQFLSVLPEEENNPLLWRIDAGIRGAEQRTFLTDWLSKRQQYQCGE